MANTLRYALERLEAAELELVSAKVALNNLGEEKLWQQLQEGDVHICMVLNELRQRVGESSASNPTS